MKDSELIQKVHSGNKEAVGIIIERYYADIYRFCPADFLPSFAPIRNRWTYQLCINLPQFRNDRLEFICQHILLEYLG